MHCVSRMSKTHWKGGERIIEKGSVGTSLFLLESGLALAISNGTVVEELAEVCVAVCCSVLQCVAVWCSELLLPFRMGLSLNSSLRCVLQCAVACCSVLQCVAVWCSELLLPFRMGLLLNSSLRCVLQCAVACCSVLQCVAVSCSCHFEWDSY